MKKIRKIFLVLLLGFICLATVPKSITRADFGNFAGDSDFGSSSWNVGGNSFDRSDNDYNSQGYSSYGGYYEDDEYDNPLITAAAFILLAGILLLVMYIISSKKNPEGRQAGAALTPQSKLKPISEYKKIDPNFDENEFMQRASNIYIQMQNGWTKKNIEELKPYLTDIFYNQADRQLDAYRKNNKTDYVEDIAVLGADIRGYYQENNNDHIIVLIRTRIKDYTLDDATGKLVSGSQSKEKFMTYEWDMIRTSGVITEKSTGTRTINCPNCGAAININQSARCPYCQSIIQVEAHDWALTGIKGISQQTGK